MDRIYYEVVTVPAGTLQASPFSAVIPLEDNQLVSITVVVPDGHCGLTGIRLLQSQQQVFPWANNSYIVANDERIIYDYKDEIQASGMTAEGFNTDIFDHSFYFRFTITNLPEPGAEPSAEAVTPGQAPAVYVPETDQLNTENIVASVPDVSETETIAPDNTGVTSPDLLTVGS